MYHMAALEMLKGRRCAGAAPWHMRIASLLIR